MTSIVPVRGMVAAGLLSLAIALERLVNAALVDGIASYASTRFVVAVACAAGGGTMLVLAAVSRRRRSRRPRR